MITTYTCRHCKTQCPPFRYSEFFDFYFTQCAQCGVDYRIVSQLPVVYENKGCDYMGAAFFQHGILAFRAEISDHIKELETELEKYALLLWEAEQAERYEKCAELRDKIKELKHE